METTTEYTLNTHSGNSSLFTNNLTLLKDNSTQLRTHGIFREITWLTYFSNITVPVLFLIGIIGNILTIIISRSKLYKHSSHGMYLTALVVADMTFLFTFPFNKNFMITFFGQDIRALKDWGCKLHYCIFRWSKMCSSWFVVLICFERFISVWFPFKAKSFSTRRAALVSVCGISMFLLVFCGLWSLTSGVKSGICLPVLMEAQNFYLRKVFSYMGMAVRSFTPTLILLTLTPLTVIRLYNQQSLRRRMKNTVRNDEMTRTTLMLLSVVIAYIVLITPFCTTKHYLLLQGIDIVTSPLNWARDLYEVTQIFEQTNAVINFILYVIVNSTVRRYFYGLLNCFYNENENSSSSDVLSHETVSAKI